MVNVGIYTRISSDDDTRTRRTGVARQERDCRAYANVRGWSVVDVYEDNDISAIGGYRPAYDRLLDDLRVGRIDRVLVLAQDRLLRRPEQLEALIELHERLGIPTIECVVAGPIDTTTSSGRINARIKGAVDRWYAEYVGEKLREQKRHAALSGQPVAGGRRPFGHECGWMTVVPGEAELIREAAARVLAGESVLDVVKDWNRRGVPTVSRTAEWSARTLRVILISPRVAGLRAHRGVVVASGTWPAILDPQIRLDMLEHLAANIAPRAAP